jgi:hypothetical protein
VTGEGAEFGLFIPSARELCEKGAGELVLELCALALPKGLSIGSFLGDTIADDFAFQLLEMLRAVNPKREAERFTVRVIEVIPERVYIDVPEPFLVEVRTRDGRLVASGGFAFRENKLKYTIVDDSLMRRIEAEIVPRALEAVASGTEGVLQRLVIAFARDGISVPDRAIQRLWETLIAIPEPSMSDVRDAVVQVSEARLTEFALTAVPASGTLTLERKR